MNEVVPPATRSKIIVFDLNETLLDIATLEPVFQRTFGDRHVMREWFAK